MTERPEAAMIFAAGFGTRMGELTREVPKPLLPLAGRPLIDHAVARLKAAGIGRIVVNAHYLHDRLQRHFAGSDVVVLHETPDILDTGGGLLAARDHLGSGPVITVNPDAGWTGPNPVSALIGKWRPDLDALLALVPLERAVGRRGGGDFSLENGRIRRKGDYVYTGTQIIRTGRMEEIGRRIFSLNAYWDLLIATGRVEGHVHDGHWCDIGHPEGLALAEGLGDTAHVRG